MTLVSICLPANGVDSRAWTSWDDCSSMDEDTAVHSGDALAWPSDVVDL